MGASRIHSGHVNGPRIQPLGAYTGYSKKRQNRRLNVATTFVVTGDGDGDGEAVVSTGLAAIVPDSGVGWSMHATGMENWSTLYPSACQMWKNFQAEKGRHWTTTPYSSAPMKPSKRAVPRGEDSTAQVSVPVHRRHLGPPLATPCTGARPALSDTSGSGTGLTGGLSAEMVGVSRTKSKYLYIVPLLGHPPPTCNEAEKSPQRCEGDASSSLRVKRHDDELGVKIGCLCMLHEALVNQRASTPYVSNQKGKSIWETRKHWSPSISAMRKGQGSARKEVTALVDFHPSSSVFAEFPGNLGSLAFLGGGSLRGILWSPAKVTATMQVTGYSAMYIGRFAVVPVHATLGCPICEQQFFSQSPPASTSSKKRSTNSPALVAAAFHSTATTLMLILCIFGMLVRLRSTAPVLLPSIQFQITLQTHILQRAPPAAEAAAPRLHHRL
ncbi:uncharacterized protein TRIVIDRAFT_70527 [Trichoderma virens Gv29-8]|uniref:Uncharacterized protein n=1 Tax=Hypocrea virens (strain Gv29-8 / FGSC 10586) TaxID=413071 RepID=G9MG96_HYPVG|nr:uncharacterized protein TRIVIDRAFT_70527 [Trichoderma virens Gv29-8]EHK26546.1 hypothetical protein TRIVIDRAFT_70527 [Trichoderma virens Gv29-8]